METKKYYTDERNVQIVLSLLKAHGIRKVIASPGTTNMTFVGSIQNDPFFEIYSVVDERSAAYMACGMAAESGEPVVLSCTGATASRNYYSGLTEAFYRKLPVLAVTSHQGTDRIGHLIAQNIDRRQLPRDLVKLSVDIPSVHDARDEHFAEMEANKAILELFRKGGGPVHINLHTRYSRDFSVRELPPCRVVHRHEAHDIFPELPKGGIAIFAGAHRPFTAGEAQAIDAFCAEHDAVVFCDHSSGYHGQYRVQAALLLVQKGYVSPLNDFSLLIHIGEVTGDYSSSRIKAKEVWRVSPDGELRDTFSRLTRVFEMPEECFFKAYTPDMVPSVSDDSDSTASRLREEIRAIRKKMPELGLSNVWIASRLSGRLPQGCKVHLGILNTLRTWNLFDFPGSVESFCNVGGFGIDGNASALIGASLVHTDVLYFGIFGDLSFFYDMNSLGNRHVGNNVRILLVNNGKGAEFRLYSHPCSAFGEDADRFMAAAGHNGNKSASLVRHYAEDLGYEYLSATTEEEFLKVEERFLCPHITEKPMIFEVFTDSRDESDALEAISRIMEPPMSMKEALKDTVKKAMGEKAVKAIKKLMGR